MKKHAKIIFVGNETTQVVDKEGRVTEWKTDGIPQTLREEGAFITIEESTKEIEGKGEYTVTIEKGEPFEMVCTCPKTCNCQNPPPANWDGIHGNWGISNSCPDHNQHPEPDENCPIHG